MIIALRSSYQKPFHVVKMTCTWRIVRVGFTKSAINSQFAHQVFAIWLWHLT